MEENFAKNLPLLGFPHFLLCNKNVSISFTHSCTILTKIFNQRTTIVYFKSMAKLYINESPLWEDPLRLSHQ